MTYGKITEGNPKVLMVNGKILFTSMVLDIVF